ncbi:hypothetical protein IL306_014140 [Fusarium sp. DS 682]|nr:hypothetical protein IL306_014140 [Fusarium sp. DS 682]
MATEFEQDYEDPPEAEFDLAEDELDDDNDHNYHSQHPDLTWADRLEDARNVIKNQRKFTSHAQVDEFFIRFKDVTRQCNSPTGNMLHVLVEVVKHNGLIPEEVELLVRRLVERAPDLVKVPNKEKQTPILMAIRTCQDRLLEYMISTCIEHQNQQNAIDCLNDALSYTHDGTKTALHVAFEEKLNWKSLKMLVEHASNETLSIGDNMKKTPMHHAVHFQKCNQKRTELIDLFIQKDSIERLNKPKSAKTFLDMCDKDDCSVFQEHQNTRKSWEQQISRPRPLSKAAPDPADSPKTGDRLPPRDLKLQARTRESKPQASIKGPGDRDGDRSGRKGHKLTATEEQELLRQKKKEEEQAKLKRDGSSVKDYQPSDNDESARRDSSPYRSPRTNEIDESMQIRIPDPVRQTEPSPNTAIRRSNTARDKGVEPESRNTTAKQIAAAQKEQKVRNHINNSERILQKLKLYYMRTRNPEMVMFFLYGKNMNDIQTGFDYCGSPSPISWKDFKKRFGAGQSQGYRFDSVLQYATFPYVKVIEKLSPAEKEASEKTSEQSSYGRKDIKYFLDWLYLKGVRHIIKLSVEESTDVGQGVHGDQTIQEALGKFVVERLDWKKTDLDPETMLHIGSQIESPSSGCPNDDEPVIESQVRKLTLMWSGSNAVLRAWSDEHALPKMRFLQEVEIIRPPSHLICDSKEWIEKKIGDFEGRLNKNREPLPDGLPSTRREVPFGDTPLSYIQVRLVDPTTGNEQGVTSHGVFPTNFLDPDKGINAHRWLGSVEEFASVMEPFWKSTVDKFRDMNQNMGTAERIERDVTIALIDDGVDKFQIGRPDQVLEGKSFDFHDERVNPPYLSAKGHGTTMARMILRVCPMAKIYPIRLKTFNDPNGNLTIHADYAARVSIGLHPTSIDSDINDLEAIQAALDKKADIISMSWTVPMETSQTTENPLKTNRELIRQRDMMLWKTLTIQTFVTVRKVLQKATNETLLFCSAPDKGKFTEADYPSAPFPDKFFRIGAANSDGTVFNWTPEDITFVLPGVQVAQDQIRSKSSKPSQEKEMRDQTGSSVATALGAGLAAMILYCIKASILGIKIANRNRDAISAIPAERLKQIMQRDAMKGAFESLGLLTSNKFIQVWEELDKVSGVLRKWEKMDPDSEASLKFTRDFIEFGIKLANSAK